MKLIGTILTSAALVLALTAAPSLPASAQSSSPVKENRALLHYKVIDGDTVFVESLRPVYKWDTGKRPSRDWKKYRRLVYNFSKTYPYALVGRKLVEQTDSTFQADKMRRRKKEKYVNDLQKELFAAYEEPLKNMTISQGQLLMKLIDREVGKSSFNIIREYKSGLTAGFWQGVAKMFGSDLKRPYDPAGEDKDTEELVQIWRRGDFPYYYLSIFGEFPKMPEIPSKYK